MAGSYPVPGFSHVATAHPQGTNLDAGQVDVAGVSSRLLGILDQLGAELGKTVVVFSGRRSDAYSAKVGGFAGDPHTLGIAADATIDGRPVGSYPGAVAILHRLGARSGATDFTYKGASDPAHVDLVTQPVAQSAGQSGTTRADFLTGVLKRIGAPTEGLAGRRNLDFMVAWARAEGTSAAFNPLATTRDAPGATSFNSVGVKNYTSFEQGVGATADTISSGYPAVVGYLKVGQPQSILTTARGQSDLNKWVSGKAVPGYTSYVSNVFKLYSGSGKSAADWSSSDLGLGKTVKAAVDATLALPKFLAKITDTHNILRGLQVIAGAVLVLVGVVLLTRQVALAADVPLPNVPVPVPIP